MTPSYHDPILVLTADPQVNSLVETLLQPEGYAVKVFSQIAEVRKSLNEGLPRLVILGEKLSDGSGLAFARELNDISPTTPVLLFIYQESTAILKQAIQAGVLDTFYLPIRGEDLLILVRNGLAVGDRRRGWMQKETRLATANLRSQMTELETLGQLSRSITSQLDLDSVLSTVMDTPFPYAPKKAAFYWWMEPPESYICGLPATLAKKREPTSGWVLKIPWRGPSFAPDNRFYWMKKVRKKSRPIIWFIL